MTPFPPVVAHELPGWLLFWADLERAGDAPEGLGALRRTAAAQARASFGPGQLAEQPTVAALRRLYRQAGTDPTRYRPSSEALLRRLLKGEEIPAISPLVDLNNCLSAELAAPVCVMDVRYLRPPFVFRAGQEGEAYESLRGPFNLDGKPLLVDGDGPCDTPITGGVRVMVREDTARVWLVAYLPRGVVTGEMAEAALRRLADAAPVARVHAVGTTTEAA